MCLADAKERLMSDRLSGDLSIVFEKYRVGDEGGISWFPAMPGE